MNVKGEQERELTTEEKAIKCARRLLMYLETHGPQVLIDEELQRLNRLLGKEGHRHESREETPA